MNDTMNVLVVSGVAKLDKYVTQKVAVKGTLKGNALKVESVLPPK